MYYGAVDFNVNGALVFSWSMQTMMTSDVTPIYIYRVASVGLAILPVQYCQNSGHHTTLWVLAPKAHAAC